MRSSKMTNVRGAEHTFAGAYTPAHGGPEYTFSVYWFSCEENLVWRARVFCNGTLVGQRDGRIKGVNGRSHDNSLVEAKIWRFIDGLQGRTTAAPDAKEEALPGPDE